jgi:hypothetical protein
MAAMYDDKGQHRDNISHLANAKKPNSEFSERNNVASQVERKPAAV